jgi:hypothetical protein
MEIGRIPWVLAILTAGWFGWMASRAGRNWILWAVGGAAFGLVTSTIILGLAHAASIPFSNRDRKVDQLEWTMAAVAVIGVGGWALTSSLHRHHLIIWRKIKPGPCSEEPATSEAKPAGTPLSKQPGSRP